MPMVGGVVSNYVDDGRLGSHGVVKVGQAVGEPRTKVQQRGGRTVEHPGVSVSRTRHGALEKPKDASDAIDPVERVNKVHLGRAWVREAHVNTAAYECGHQALGSRQCAFANFDSIRLRRQPGSSR